MARLNSQIITGVVPPQIQEALIREVWAAVTASPGPSAIARKLMGTVFLAPLGWLLLLPLFVKRLLGFLPGLSGLTVKYTITNRRLMIRKGMKARPVQEIALSEIGDVRLVQDANSEFYLTGTLEVLRKDGTVALTLTGVPEPESFRHTIQQARDAWGAIPATGDKIPS
ncbi:MAG TPA: PH domain-containing protein [Gemmataceae bacterium]|nr:PH domain-containing protein [Gemmataceae bacterium]